MDIVDTLSAILNHKKSKAVWTIPPDHMVFEAIQLMSGKNIGALPVVRDTVLVGIVSERDYTRKVILKGRSSRDTPVGDIMTVDVVTDQTSAHDPLTHVPIGYPAAELAARADHAQRDLAAIRDQNLAEHDFTVLRT